MSSYKEMRYTSEKRTNIALELFSIFPLSYFDVAAIVLGLHAFHRESSRAKRSC